MEITKFSRDANGEIYETIKREIRDHFDLRLPTVATNAPDGLALMTVHLVVAVRDGFIEEASVQRNDVSARGLPADQADHLRKFGNVSTLTPAR